jgi:hypothetical protein
MAFPKLMAGHRIRFQQLLREQFSGTKGLKRSQQKSRQIRNFFGLALKPEATSPPANGRVHPPTFADAEDCSHLPGVPLSLQNLSAALCTLPMFPSCMEVARLLDQNNRSLGLLTEVGTQCERAVIVQLLVTSPPHGIAHSLYLNLSFKFQSFPICDVRKHELCLPNLAR